MRSLNRKIDPSRSSFADFVRETLLLVLRHSSSSVLQLIHALPFHDLRKRNQILDAGKRKRERENTGPFFVHNITIYLHVLREAYVRVSVTKKKTRIGTGWLRLGWRKQRNRGENDSCSTANTISRKYAFQMYPTKNTPLYIFAFHYPKVFHETAGENEMSLVSSPPFSSLALSAVAQDKGGGGEGTGTGIFFRQGKGRERVVSRLSTSLGRRRRKEEGGETSLQKKEERRGAGGGLSTDRKPASSVGRKARAQRHTPFFLQLSLSPPSFYATWLIGP